MAKYKLTYFDLPGFGEPIRYLLSMLGEEWEDRRISRDEWPSIKPTTPFGKVPILEFDGKVACQSTAICRYLGKKAKLAGEDDWENLQIDIIIDTLADMRLAMMAYWFEKNEEAKDKKLEELRNETFPFYLGKLDDLTKNNNGYLANGKLSWADIYFASTINMMSERTGYSLKEKHDNLSNLVEKVHALPQIKKWTESRP